MTNNLQTSSSLLQKYRVALYAFALVSLFVSSSCQSSQTKDDAQQTRGIIIVNAPAAGEVRRVLVREGMTVSEGTPIVEIAVRTGAQSAPPTQAEDPVARAGRNIETAQAEIEAARAEVVRAQIEVQRLTPLVASGDVPQAQLDGARALYERAQQRLQQAQSSAQNAQDALVAARQPSPNSSPATALTPLEQIVTANASSAGTVSVISARPGERVAAGQPLATLRAGER